MFKIYFALSLFFSFALLSRVNTNEAKPPSRKLIWADEFNYYGLPTDSLWNFEEGNGCPKLCGWGNNELEYYTVRNTENAIVENGVLKITALKKQKNNNNYTSAKITTKNKMHFKYGRMECRAKLPTTKGTWPAFWMLGANIDSIGWPKCGEIDIMEHKGNALNKIYGTLHYPKFFGDNGNGNTKMIDDVTQFHVYATEWNQKYISFFVDNKLVHSVKNDKDLPFHKDFYFILNLAVGGNFAGAVDANFTKETMQVDYVRVYQ